MNDSMYVASYLTTQFPTLSIVLGQDLPASLDDWTLWNRFWPLVVCDMNSHCWLWQRPLNSEGYGTMKVIGRNQPIHRVVYQWLVGPILKDLVIDHLCRTRHCVNPDHLEAVTAIENVLRGNGALAVHRRKTHCPQGHPYDEVNTIWLPGGTGRRCRTCADGYYMANRDRLQPVQRAAYRSRIEATGRKVLPPAKDRTECKFGHPFDETNTRITTAGVRQCRECGRRRDRERYANDPVRKASVKARAKAAKLPRDTPNVGENK